MITIDASLLESLLACTPEQVAEWCEWHRDRLGLSLLQVLKEHYVDFGKLTADPLRAELATRLALQLAEQMADEPLAVPLANWARGNWSKLYAPQEAIQQYRIAEAGYLAASDEISVARLRGNLIGVLTECGRFAEAEEAYQLAQTCLIQFPHYSLYLLFAEQNYGWLLYNQGRYDEALLAYERAMTLADENQLLTTKFEIGVNRNLALGMLGRLTEVEVGFWQERANALAHGQILTVARIDMNLGEFYTSTGQPAIALRQFRAAQQTFADLELEMDVGWTLHRQATLLQRIGAQQAAIVNYTKALAIAKSKATIPQIGELLINLASLRRQQGEEEAAYAHLTEAETLWQKLANPFWLIQIVVERIELALAQADFTRAHSLLQQLPALPTNQRMEAVITLLQATTLRGSQREPERAWAAYQETYRYALAQHDRWLQRQALAGQGHLLLQQGQGIKATSLLEQAALVDDQIRKTLTVEELKAGFHDQTADLFPTLIQIAVEAGEYVRALSYIWRAKASNFLELYSGYDEKRRLPGAVSQAINAAFHPARNLAETVSTLQQRRSAATQPSSEIDQVRQQLATLRWQQAMQADAHYPDGQREQSTPAIAQLEHRLLELRRFNNQVDIAQQTHFRFDPILLLRDMKADLLLEYVRCGDDILGVRATKAGECYLCRLTDVETALDLRDRLYLSFQNVGTRSPQQRLAHTPHWLAECYPLLQQCYQIFVAPLLNGIKLSQRMPHILLALCDPLYLLPFAAFWDGQQYWMERCQLEHIPSGALLVLPRAQANTYTPATIIAAATGHMTAVQQEAMLVATHLPDSKIFIDAPALDYLRALPQPPQILHIAAHTIVRDDAPLFSGLQLYNEILSVEACYDLPLNGTALVTLSGCTTAGGQESGGALLAFQSACLIAGAQHVVSSLWSVADDVAPIWMSHFYAFLAQGLSPRIALQQTQQMLVTDPAYSHPALWAAFICTRR